MRLARAWFLFFLAALAAGGGTAPLAAQDSVLKPEEVVARSLDALGSAPVRSAASRVAQGTAHYRILVGGAGTLEGKQVFVSQGPMLQLMMKFANNDYRGEQFIYDGEKSQVAATTVSMRRSLWGEFVHTQDAVFREGLIGGVLSTAWPLLDLARHQPKLACNGLKKVDNRELHELRYQPHKRSDLEIYLYFEPGTFRHVLTVYKIAIRPQIGRGEIETAHQQETRYRLEERFSDFKTVEGLTLPAHWDIHFTAELADGSTSVLEWDIVEEQVSNNVSLDPRNFLVK